MSYQCEKCKATQPNGTPSVRVVVETREKVYPFRKDANPRAEVGSRDDPGGRGREIAREMVVCPECGAK